MGKTGNKNVADIISSHALHLPDAIAVKTPGASISYAELDTLIWRTVTYLHQEGVRAADNVAVHFKDELTLLVVLFATARMGATALSFPSGNSLQQAEKTVSHDIKPAFLAAETVHPETEELQSIPIDLGIIQKLKGMEKSKYDPSPRAPWLIIEGSGSTGKSKLMSISHGIQLARMRTGMQWLPSHEGDTVASLVHLRFPVSIMLYLEALYAGLTVALIDKNTLDAKQFFPGADISILHATVYHVHFLLQSRSEDLRAMTRGLKALLIGGSPVSDSLRMAVTTRLTPNLFVRYGTIEVNTATVTSTPELLQLANTVGRPLKNVTIEIVNSSGEPLPPGHTGTVRIQSAGMIHSYFKDAAATQNAFKDGWFYPQDMGKLSADGQLILLGRADDMIILNGMNIFPAEIETVLLRHPEVADAVVIPLSSETFGNIPVAITKLHPDASTTSKLLLQYCREKLNLRAPRRIVTVSELPRTPQGKISKQELLTLLKPFQEEK